MMSRVKKGVIAGLVATIGVSLLEGVNLLLGPLVSPFPGIVAYLIGMAGNLPVGWAVHFLAGTFVLGALFGAVYPRLPTSTPETKGILFAVAAWVGMLLFITMTGDARMFRSETGVGVVVWMLATHMIYGGVMGHVYSRLAERERRRASTVLGGAPAH